MYITTGYRSNRSSRGTLRIISMDHFYGWYSFMPTMVAEMIQSTKGQDLWREMDAYASKAHEDDDVDDISLDLIHTCHWA